MAEVALQCALEVVGLWETGGDEPLSVEKPSETSIEATDAPSTEKPDAIPGDTAFAPEEREEVPSTFCVYLEGLPKQLCQNRRFIAAMFEQRGWDEALVSYDIIWNGAETGDVAVTFSKPEVAYTCLLHCWSCCWRPMEMPVRAYMISPSAATAFSSAASCLPSFEDDRSTEVSENCDEAKSQGTEETTSSPEELSSAANAPDLSLAEGKSDVDCDSQKMSSSTPPLSSRRPPPAAAQRQRSRGRAVPRDDQKSLLIAYIPREAKSSELAKVFSKFGEVESISIMRDRDGLSKCFGFCNFYEHEAAQKALDRCLMGSLIMRDTNGKSWHIKAEWAAQSGGRVRRACSPGVRRASPKKTSFPNRYEDDSDAHCDDQPVSRTGIRARSLAPRRLGLSLGSAFTRERGGLGSVDANFRSWADIDSDSD